MRWLLLIYAFTCFLVAGGLLELYYFIAFNMVIIIAILLYTDPAFLRVMAQKYLKSGIAWLYACCVSRAL